MNRKHYIREIVQRSCLPPAERRRLENDLKNEIDTALDRGESMEQIIERMGEPDGIAAALYENFAAIPVRPFREYKSKTTLFGLPLVHIIGANYAPAAPYYRTAGAGGFNGGGNCGAYFGLPAARGIFAFGPRAKGVVAVGNFAAGFISVGNISAGILSVGNISAGLFTLGNIALAALTAVGNFAAGLLCAGNAALGYAAAGNFALGQYAVGNRAVGGFAFSFRSISAHFEELQAFLLGLNAPAPVKLFYGVMEKFYELLTGPLPLYFMLLAVLAGTLSLLIIIPRRFLNKHT